MSRYHGFTCPECGSHYFSTEFFNDAAPIGKCTENQYSKNGCAYKWCRDDAEAEGVCMYEMAREEFLADGTGHTQSHNVGIEPPRSGRLQ